jgi:hypothetical protein
VDKYVKDNSIVGLGTGDLVRCAPVKLTCRLLAEQQGFILHMPLGGYATLPCILINTR